MSAMDRDIATVSSRLGTTADSTFVQRWSTKVKIVHGLENSLVLALRNSHQGHKHCPLTVPCWLLELLHICLLRSMEPGGYGHHKLKRSCTITWFKHQSRYPWKGKITPKRASYGFRGAGIINLLRTSLQLLLCNEVIDAVVPMEIRGAVLERPKREQNELWHIFEIIL